MEPDPGGDPTVIIEVQAGAEAVFVRAHGRLALGSGGNPDARRLRAAVDEAVGLARGRPVVLDLSGLAYTFGDSVAGVVLDEGVVVLLGRPSADAWNSLLTVYAPHWSGQLGWRIHFVDPVEADDPAAASRWARG